jgi:hypothetical protein
VEKFISQFQVRLIVSTFAIALTAEKTRGPLTRQTCSQQPQSSHGCLVNAPLKYSTFRARVTLVASAPSVAPHCRSPVPTGLLCRQAAWTRTSSRFQMATSLQRAAPSGIRTSVQCQTTSRSQRRRHLTQALNDRCWAWSRLLVSDARLAGRGRSQPIPACTQTGQRATEFRFTCLSTFHGRPHVRGRLQPRHAWRRSGPVA